MNSWKFPRHSLPLAALAAGVALAASVWAPRTLAQDEPPRSAAATVKTWESAEERLTMLLDQVPEQARSGIERALEANREGRLKAQEALSRGDEQRAQRALEAAAARAESGLNQARAHVPANVLPRLDEAAAKMSASRPAPASGRTSTSTSDQLPSRKPAISQPGGTLPNGMSHPSPSSRPVTPPGKP